ncbi:MAG TPA: hypothetical protein GXX21_08440 [Syntrophomonadaceae bacterium]|nr:hypothetical protein [Syntrophomonadaceae bacterium]
MSLFFLLPLLAIVVTYFAWHKLGSKINARSRKIIKLLVYIITWVSMVYQFISIAHYIDDSGEQISNVIGEHGLILSWVSLIIFSFLLIWTIFETIGKNRNKK